MDPVFADEAPAFKLGRVRSDPTLVAQGAAGDPAARALTRQMVQRWTQRTSAAGAGIAESQYQTTEATPQPLEAVQ